MHIPEEAPEKTAARREMAEDAWVDPAYIEERLTAREQEARELADEAGATLGDPRRCPRHPDQVISSPDGLFDTPCGACEYENEGED